MLRLREFLLTIFVLCTRIAWGLEGGSSPAYMDAPHYISFRTRIGLNHFCAGAIISKQWILSAAECFHNIKDVGEIVALAGCETKTHNIENTFVQTQFVEEILIHPNYSFPYNNIALIKLEKKFEFNPNVGHARLSKTITDLHGTTLIPGWGSDSSLLVYLEAPIISNEVCEEMLNATELAYSLSSTMLCTLPQKPEAGGCADDRGGPLTENQELIGIFCLTNKGCKLSEEIPTPMVYTRVPMFLEFIENIIKISDIEQAPRGSTQEISADSILYLLPLLHFLH